MTNPIQHLNKVFENRVRLGIMSSLLVNDSLDFKSMKDYLDLTDGNLSSHIALLETEGYLKIEKEFVAKKPHTTYSATAAGKRAFAEHLDALEQLIKQTNR